MFRLEFVSLQANLLSISVMKRLKTVLGLLFGVVVMGWAVPFYPHGLIASPVQDVVPQAPDYADASQWYVNDQQGVADIFYVISTETGDHMEDSDICHFANTRDSLQRSQMLMEMAAVDTFYTGNLNYYSPYYRQVSMNSLGEGENQFQKRLPLAIDDVRRSWQYYLKHFNRGRPFVLAGYSQGAAAVIALLKEMPDSIAQRMVASYVIGYAVTEKDLYEIPHIRPAKGATDTGVMICFNSVASPECALASVSGGNQLCINPVNWRTDSVGATFVYDRPLERPKPDTLRVACDPEHRLLVVSGFKNQEVLPVIGIPGNYHNYELRFYHPFIRKNIADRVAAWLKESSDRKPLTPAPEGKHPFAIIHYGCHGESCPELTEEGARRMREIAWRMAERFPEVINKDANHIGARSLRDTRSLLSMEQMMIQISRVCGIRVYHNATEAYSDFLNRQNLESCLTDPNGGALQHRLLQYLIHCTDTAKTFRQTAVFHIADKTSFFPLVCLLDVNGYGSEIDSLTTLEERGRVADYICPAGANLQWILYRKDADDEDVWIKVLLNEREASLPLPSDHAPYYRLSDFKTYYMEKVE